MCVCVPVCVCVCVCVCACVSLGLTLTRSHSHPLPTHANLREFWSTQACEPGSTDNGLLLVGNLDDNKHGKGASALTHILILDASSVFFFSLLC